MNKEMNNTKNIFNIIAMLGLVIAIYLTVVLFSTFEWKHNELWAKNYGPLVSAFGILIAAALASTSAIRTIQNTTYIENARKEDALIVKKLYFNSVMEGMSITLDTYEVFLDKTFKKEQGQVKNVSEDVKNFLKEMDEVIRDYINIINNESLPYTIKNTKTNFAQAMEDFTRLKTHMYHVKPMLKTLSNNNQVNLTDVKLTLTQISTISTFAKKLKDSDNI